jgi:hypothetical protein
MPSDAPRGTIAQFGWILSRVPIATSEGGRRALLNALGRHDLLNDVTLTATTRAFAAELASVLLRRGRTETLDALDRLRTNDDLAGVELRDQVSDLYNRVQTLTNEEWNVVVYGNDPSPVSPSMPFSELRPIPIMEIVNVLLDCPSMQTPASRDTVLNQIRPEIRRSVQRNPRADLDVLNMVSASSNYSGGLAELLEVVRTLEGNSIPMQRVDALVRPFADRLRGENGRSQTGVTSK